VISTFKEGSKNGEGKAHLEALLKRKSASALGFRSRETRTFTSSAATVKKGTMCLPLKKKETFRGGGLGIRVKIPGVEGYP